VLICRGYEAHGSVTEDQPIWPCHAATLFVCRKNPFDCTSTLQEHVDWTNRPESSYLADGTGGLVVWAHPDPRVGRHIAAVRGLAGMEINCGGRALLRDQLWDEVLTLRHDAGRRYLWGFAADDTHSKDPRKIGLSFLEARMGEFSERALKAALRSGAFYASNGPRILDVQVTGGTITLKLGQLSDVRWLKSGQWYRRYWDGKVESTPALRIDRGVLASSYTLNAADGTTDPGTGRFVRALVTVGEEKAAQTMPFRITGPDSLENPYPPSGFWFRGQTHNHCDATGRKRRSLEEYHRVYRSIGHHWNFATDYGYWLTPFQRYPRGAIPVVEGVAPDRIAAGAAATVTVRGRGLSPRDTVLVAGRAMPDVKWLHENRMEVRLPAGLPPGVHDLSVRTPGGFQDTLPAGLTVRQRGAEKDADWRTWTTLNSALPGDRVLCVAAGADGSVWAGTQYGAARFADGRWTPFTRDADPLFGDAILGLAVDAKGRAWTSHFRGLTRIGPDGRLVRFRPEGGLADRRLNQVMITAKGHVWVSYNGKSAKVSRSTDDGKSWEHFEPVESVRMRIGLGLAEDRAGRVYFAPYSSGVAVFDGKAWTLWNAGNSGLPDDYVRRIFAARDGTVWFAMTPRREKADDGLCVLREGKWRSYSPEEGGLPHRRVWDVCVDRSGNTWCATGRGAARLSPEGKWTVYATRNSGLAFDNVQGVAEAADGSIWFATGRGVSRFGSKKGGK
jgi:hypothetical protein